MLLASPPHCIADLGLGRTFQNLALFPTLSVRQNVMVGVHRRTRATSSNALAMPWVGREERETRKQADASLAFLGLQRVADHPAAGLPTARSSAWAGAGAVGTGALLADEPVAGLNHEEVGALGAVLKSIRTTAA